MSDDDKTGQTPGAAARLQYEQDEAARAAQENEGSEFGDPTPPSLDAPREERLAYNREVNAYSTEILQCLKDTGLKSNELWIEFTCSFSVATVRAMHSTQQIAWTQFLTSEGMPGGRR